MEGVSSVRMPMAEEGKVDGWYVYILFSFGIVYSHNCISHSIHFLFLFTKLYYRRQSTDGVLATVREGTMMSRGWLEWKAWLMR